MVDMERADTYSHELVLTSDCPDQRPTQTKGAESLLSNSSADTAAATGLSLVAIASVLLRRRRVILAFVIVLPFVSGLYHLLKPRTYTVSSSFIVRSNNAGGAAGLAAQLGVEVGGADVSQSPIFYATLVRTPDVLMRLADSAFATSDNPKPRALADIWEISEREPRMRRDEVVTALQRVVTSNIPVRLDLVSVSVATRDPLLSQELAEAVLVQINRFNLQTLQSRAGAERRFSEGRMIEVQGELRTAESALQRFLEDNRQEYLSPALTIEKARLGRKIDLLQQTFSTLATSFERARIDEVRDTPLITIIERPITPVRPDPRGTISSVVLMVFLGLLAGSAIAILLEALSWMRSSESEETREFNGLLADASNEVRSIRRALPRAPWANSDKKTTH
ncbi:MAG: lipopolysaccharide biosynthesis protein [Gemmatimonadetes bacterium]|nr:lipopolysaccharide biosynthesis protein [Gemmatimonadota bacterium]